MTSRETLAIVADVYTPLLALASLVVLARTFIQAPWREAGLQLLGLSAALVIVYGLMFLDAHFGLWPAWSLDYSTHTAVALVLVLFLVARRPRLTGLWVGSLIAYALLMVYQRYHTLADIASTAAVVVLPVWWVFARLSVSRRAM